MGSETNVGKQMPNDHRAAIDGGRGLLSSKGESDSNGHIVRRRQKGPEWKANKMASGAVQQYLPAVKCLRETGNRRTLDPTDSMHGLESIRSEPMLGGLSLEVFHEQLDLAATKLLGEWGKEIWTTQIAIVFEDLVLKNQMISEGVPGQVRQNAVVLMPIITVVGEDHIGIELCFDLFKPVLD